jgi:serine/threonine-protein kinase
MATPARPSVSALQNVTLPDRYEVAHHIASGGMASVWRAHDRLLDRAVAIKLLSSQFAHDEQAVTRFKREARAAARLSGHPHVVTIYDVGDAGPPGVPPSPGGYRPFIVMQYLEGGTVADALRAGPVKRDEAMRWITQAATALDYAHSLGVVHRDIKPANFLLDRNRELHVADFGIARMGGEGTITGSGELFGTAAYLSPEQALGRRATAASDRYALVVAAFELLTGERPFAAELFAAQARQHVEQPAPAASSRNPALSPGVDTVLARGLAKRPEQRWPTAQAFVDALEQALRRAEANAPPLLRLAGAPAARRDASSRPRALALGTLAALVATVLALALLTGALESGKPKSAPASGAHRSPASVRAASTPRPTRSTAGSPAPGAAASTRPNAAASTPPQASTPASTHASPAEATALQARGHQLMLGGDYAAAVGLLRKAVAAAPPSSLTYAYALYDLGRSLMLAGDPQAAIAVLEQRLRIPNQTDTVRQTLELARRAVNQSQAGGL